VIAKLKRQKIKNGRVSKIIVRQQNNTCRSNGYFFSCPNSTIIDEGDRENKGRNKLYYTH
jgi:ribosomal protein L14